jgi:hypothetical protein
MVSEIEDFALTANSNGLEPALLKPTGGEPFMREVRLDRLDVSPCG